MGGKRGTDKGEQWQGNIAVLDSSLLLTASNLEIRLFNNFRLLGHEAVWICTNYQIP